MRGKQLSLVSALSWIVLSTLVITGGGYKAVRSYLIDQNQKEKNPKTQLRAILQTGPQKEALKTLYFAELLNLSMDRPIQLQQLDVKLAEKTLLASPLIKAAHLKKIKPDTLYIDYSVRSPLAFLLDYENIAIDEEKQMFPILPFFSPKTLPEIYLGLPSFSTLMEDPLAKEKGWPPALKGKEIDLALALLQQLSLSAAETGFNLRRIDVSRAYAESFGRREIVLILEEEKVKLFLRLSSKNYVQELANYLSLRPKLLEEITTINHASKQEQLILDLRLPHLGFIHTVDSD